MTNLVFEQKTHQAAIVTRDLARQNQHRKEIELLSEGKERERRLIEYRWETLGRLRVRWAKG